MKFKQSIITAGVYVKFIGFFVFQVGPTKSGKTLGIARVGGHREGSETGWECVALGHLQWLDKLIQMHPEIAYNITG